MRARPIRFELTGPGQVDLDDVVLTDLDFTEAGALQFQAHYAGRTETARGELGECARSTATGRNSCWHTPPRKRRQPNILTAERPRRNNAAPAETPGIKRPTAQHAAGVLAVTGVTAAAKQVFYPFQPRLLKKR
jgi:hypothetical protein